MKIGRDGYTLWRGRGNDGEAGNTMTAPVSGAVSVRDQGVVPAEAEREGAEAGQEGLAVVQVNKTAAWDASRLGVPVSVLVAAVVLSCGAMLGLTTMVRSEVKVQLDAYVRTLTAVQASQGELVGVVDEVRELRVAVRSLQAQLRQRGRPDLGADGVD